MSRQLEILYSPAKSTGDDFWLEIAATLSTPLYFSADPDAGSWTRLARGALPQGDHVALASSPSAREPSFYVSAGANECLLGVNVPGMLRLNIQPIDDGRVARDFAQEARRRLDGVLLLESGPVIVGRDELEKDTLAEALASRPIEMEADEDAEITAEAGAIVIDVEASTRS